MFNNLLNPLNDDSSAERQSPLGGLFQGLFGKLSEGSGMDDLLQDLLGGRADLGDNQDKDSLIESLAGQLKLPSGMAGSILQFALGLLLSSFKGAGERTAGQEEAPAFHLEDLFDENQLAERADTQELSRRTGLDLPTVIKYVREALALLTGRKAPPRKRKKHTPSSSTTRRKKTSSSSNTSTARRKKTSRSIDKPAKTTKKTSRPKSAESNASTKKRKTTSKKKPSTTTNTRKRKSKPAERLPGGVDES